MISILMPIYNGIQFIQESVSSILSQTFEDWELLIGINGHPPNSEVFQTAIKLSSDNKFNQNEKIRVFDIPSNIQGKSNTLNYLLDFCIYDWISLLDVDDIWYPSKLEAQIPFTKNFDVIGSKCQYFGNSSIIPFVPEGDISNFDFKLGNPIINSSCLVKKELCWWNSNYFGVEDYKLWLTLKLKGCKFYNSEKILVKHRIHLQSYFNNNENQEKAKKQLLNIH